MKKNDRIKAVANVLQSVLQKRYQDILPNLNSALTALNNAGDLYVLLEACLPVLRFFILRYLTRTFETFTLKDFARYLNMK